MNRHRAQCSYGGLVGRLLLGEPRAIRLALPIVALVVTLVAVPAVELQVGHVLIVFYTAPCIFPLTTVISKTLYRKMVTQLMLLYYHQNQLFQVV